MLIDEITYDELAAIEARLAEYRTLPEFPARAIADIERLCRQIRDSWTKGSSHYLNVTLTDDEVSMLNELARYAKEKPYGRSVMYFSRRGKQRQRYLVCESLVRHGFASWTEYRHEDPQYWISNLGWLKLESINKSR